jgi:hypothetical protein
VLRTDGSAALGGEARSRQQPQGTTRKGSPEMFNQLVTESRTTAHRQDLLAAAAARRATCRPSTVGAARPAVSRRRSWLRLAIAPACR